MQFTSATAANLTDDVVKNLMNGIRITFVQNYGNADGQAAEKILGTAKLDVANSTVENGNSRKATLELYDVTGTTKVENGELLTSLEKNAATQISAIVWMDGNTVRNADVAATALQSLTGTLNLQFSTDVDLKPAVNTVLKKGVQ